jgi:hypothetical protein
MLNIVVTNARMIRLSGDSEAFAATKAVETLFDPAMQTPSVQVRVL